MTGEGWVTIGRIGRPRGIHGACRFVPEGIPPGRLIGIDRLQLEDAHGERAWYAVREWHSGGAALYVELEGVTDRAAAEAIRGRFVVVLRAALPPLEADEFYTSDLVGLHVENAAGEARGRVVGVEPGAAHDLLVIERDGRRHRVPAVKAFVERVDQASRRLVILEIEGLWE